jgi:type III secretory pathway component EscV
VTLTRILRDLLDEQISIRDHLTILESLLAINGTVVVMQTADQIMFVPEPYNLCFVKEEKRLSDLDISDYSNFIRTSLKRYISYKYTKGTNSLPIYLIDQQKDQLGNDDYIKIINALRSKVTNLAVSDVRPVILTNPEIRKNVRNFIKKEFPQINVLSYNELLPEVNIQLVDTIEIK